ncbi:MAG: hypothetical protein QXF79_06030 [Ignisphaera sp.]
MYKYIYTDIESIKRKLSPKTVFAWVPAQVIKFSGCRPKELYIVDCFFRTLIENPYVSVMLLRKIPKPKDLKHYDYPPMDIKKIDAECKDIINDLRQVVNDVVIRDYSKLYELLDSITEYKDTEFTIRFFLRTRRYVISAEKMKEVDRRLAIKIVEKLMDRLCLYDKKASTKLFMPIDIEKQYALIYLDPLLRVSGMAIGKHLIEVKTYLKLIKKYNLEKLFSLESLEHSPDSPY